MAAAVRKRAKRKIAKPAKGEEEKEKLNLAQLRREAQKESYLEKLSDNLGFVTKTAKDVGVSRRTPERWRKEDPDFNEKFLSIQCEQREFVESKLMANINTGSVTAQMFYLRCKGRGGEVPTDWIERRELTGNPDAPLHVEASVEVVRDEVSDKGLLRALGVAMKAAPEFFSQDDG